MKRMWVLALILLFSFSSLAEEKGVHKNEIVIGVSIGLTGVASEQCQDHVAGYSLYFNKINAMGGVNGRKIRVIAYDDNYDPMKTLANANKLIYEDNVFLLFKVYGTPTIKAILPLIATADIPVVSPSSGAEFIRHPVNKNIFHLKQGYFNEAKTMVDFFVNKKHLKKIGILYQDDSFGNEGKTATDKALARYGLKSVTAVKYKKVAEEFISEFETIVKAKPDAVVLWSLAASGAQFARLAKEKKLKALVMGNSSMTTSEFARDGEDFYITMPVPSPENQNIQIISDYLQDAKKNRVTVNPTTLQAYLDAAVLVEAMKRAGTDLTRDSLRSAFEKMNKVNLGGLELDYSSKDHVGLGVSFLNHVKNGKFIAVE